MRTRGVPELLFPQIGLLSIRVITAIRKAAVFPVPVWALPNASLPDNVLGSISAWIGVQ